jgi:hypothetical protein
MISLGPSHGEPLTGSIVIDIVVFVLLFVQRGTMLRPDSAYQRPHKNLALFQKRLALDLSGANFSGRCRFRVIPFDG